MSTKTIYVKASLSHSNIFLALSVYLREKNVILSRLKYAISSKGLLKAGSMGATALISYFSDFLPNLPGYPPTFLLCIYANC